MEVLFAALIGAVGTVAGATLGAWITARRRVVKANGIAEVKAAVRYLQEIERLKHELNRNTGRYD